MNGKIYSLFIVYRKFIFYIKIIYTNIYILSLYIAIISAMIVIVY